MKSPNNLEKKKLSFQDPDGLNLSLIDAKNVDKRKGFETAEVNLEVSIKGFHSVTLSLNNKAATAEILTEILSYKEIESEGKFTRYKSDTVETAAIVDILEDPGLPRGINAGGTNYHVAFRVKDEETLMEMRNKVLAKGLQITEKINRDYFFSLYFREPGGVLFEIATDNPGFATDETVEELGTKLQLPEKYKADRTQIEKALPEIKL